MGYTEIALAVISGCITLIFSLLNKFVFDRIKEADNKVERLDEKDQNARKELWQELNTVRQDVAVLKSKLMNGGK